MTTRQTLTFLLWLSGALAALGLSLFCVLAGSDGNISALALVPFVWTVAFSAGALQSFPRQMLKLRPASVAQARLLIAYRVERSLLGA